MFNDDDVRKSATQGVLYVVCFVCLIGALVMGLVFSIMEWQSEAVEAAREEAMPTVEYEKTDDVNNIVPTEIEIEASCEHNWVISDEYITLIRSVNLECVASEGIERVYLTRYREAFDRTGGDVYIAYDENLKDITLQYWDGVFQIEYFPAGVGMGTPRLEEYEFTLYACANEDCNEFKHVSADKLTLYRFYIPEGTYLISH